VVNCSIEDLKVVALIAGADDGGDAEIIEVGVAEARGSDSAHVSPTQPRTFLLTRPCVSFLP
jgi:hypothetical protein